MFYLYRITNIINNKVYIGQSNKEKDRWRQHKYFGKNPEKTGQYIHRAMAKYGIDNFIYEVIAVCTTEEYANELETILIAQYNSRDKQYGYNLAPGGDSPWNRGLPKEMQPMYGKTQSDSFKQKMSTIHSGKTYQHSDEWKQNMSSIMKGRKLSDDWKQKISISNKGKIKSNDTIEKMSQSHKNKKMSEDTKSKISKANIGKLKSNETKLRMSKSMSGENSYRTNLSWDIIDKIREDYSSGNFTYKEIGEKYNISLHNVGQIVRFETWKSK